MRRSYVLGLVTFLVAVVFSLVANHYDEWNTSIWGVNIIIWSVGLSLIALMIPLVFGLLDVDGRANHTPGWFLVVTVCYVFISMGLGVFFAEPKFEDEFASARYSAREYEYRNTRSGGTYYYFFGGGSSTSSSSTSARSSSSSSSGSSSSSSSKKGLGVIILIVMFLVFIFASAVVPHFWVISCTIGIVLLLAFTWKEYQLEEQENNYSLI